MSARGFGGIVRSAAQAPGGGIIGANNGLSLVGTDVQLGGTLLLNTDIDLAGSHLYINNGIDRHIELDPGVPRYLFGIIDGGLGITNAISFESDTSIIYAGTLGEALKVTQSNTQYEFGDILGGGNGLALRIDDGAIRAELVSTNGRLFFLDQTTGEYEFGDSNAVSNGNYLKIDDTFSNVWVDSGGNRKLELDSGSQLYRMGDINNVSGGNVLMINDFLNEFSLGNATNRIDMILDVAQILIGGVPLFSLDSPNGLYRFGDIANSANNNKFAIDDTNNLTYLQSGAGRKLNLDSGNNLYQIGDIDNLNSGAQISIDDFAGTINFTNSASTVGITINGTAGFTGNVIGPASITVDNGIVTNVT